MKVNDHRQTCSCGHRYSDHSPKGRCLAWNDDPTRSSLYLCECGEWTPHQAPAIMDAEEYAREYAAIAAYEQDK